MPIFGTRDPVRLLRPELVDPTNGLKNLVQELFSIYTADEPVDTKESITIHAPADRPALRIVPAAAEVVGKDASLPRKPPPPTSPGLPGRPTRPRPEVTPARPQGPVDDGGRRGQPDVATGGAEPVDYSRPYKSPAVDIEVPTRFGGEAPVHFKKPPRVLDPRTNTYKPLGGIAEADWRAAIADYGLPSTDGTAGGTSSLTMGIVTEVVAFDTYRVDLYPKGFAAPPAKNVIVLVPILNPADSLSPLTKIAPIWKTGSTYYYQPPVWLP